MSARVEPPYTGLTYKHRLLLEKATFRPEDQVAEIGVGTGYSCFKISEKVSFILGVDIAAELIAELGQLAHPCPNLEFLQADVTREDPPDPFLERFDLVYSLDTLQAIATPHRLFAYSAQLLKPGGRALVTFPNEQTEKMEGITNFPDRQTLLAEVEKGGLELESLEVADYTRWFYFINDNLWYRVKKAYYRGRLHKEEKPQVFTQTAAFRMLKEKKSMRRLVRIYSSLIMALLRIGGIYRYKQTDDIYGNYVIMHLRKKA